VLEDDILYDIKWQSESITVWFLCRRRKI